MENADGSVTAEIHLAPIRYRDEDGVWKDIDATLQEESGVLRSRETNVDLQLQTAENNVGVRAEHGDIVIAFRPVTEQGAVLESEEIRLLNPEKEEILSASESCVGVAYEDVFAAEQLRCFMRIFAKKLADSLMKHWQKSK